jgi:hypothetical protein
MFKTLIKLAMVLALGGALAGCVDANVDVQLTSATTAKATTTQIMGADFYAMIKMNAEQQADTAKTDDEGFCAKGTLSEHKDGSASCVTVAEGKFADLDMGSKQTIVAFAPAGPGLVRVSLPTDKMKDEVGANETMDEETKKMVEAFFAGHALTVKFSGLAVTETNMTLSADKMGAETKIKFLDLLQGTGDLPDEYYAIVQVP